ncbi:hypothetical protein QBC38DRAFT_475360 [Podospora fimiseda]|uniref:Defect at low temperature protein 1 n=1 Tax=Podospora fimiseda TaxID=252190 RepID=A0AAN7H116_9PEZI|nr:hypothetical protein QBC38DRAFT_475360 [Podospora fimiseda]
MSAASLCFIIIYNFFYYLLYLVLLGFLIVTPADLIQQAVPKKQSWNILVIAVCYVVSVLLILFIYATRLYVSRSVLASIPKSWIPIDKGDVPRSVRQMIVQGLSRSAAIAYEARPRVPPIVPAEQFATTGNKKAPAAAEEKGWRSKFRKSSVSVQGVGINIPQHKEVWGKIEHPGWASPTSPDLPNLQYDSVILELPNLIEAKALTLAPPDPESHTEPPSLDPDAVALLQRPDYMGLREYLTLLTDLAVLAPLPTTTEFLAKYEAARFAARPLSNEQFRNLMHLFAEILRNMHPLSPAMLARYEDDDGSSGLASTESDIDNDAPRGTSPSSAGTPQYLQVIRTRDNSSGHSRMNSSSSSGAGSAGGGGGGRGGQIRPGLNMRNSSANTWLYYQTAPTTPKSRHTVLTRQSSSESFAQTRHPYQMGSSSGSGSASLRSVGAGSVIRLAGDGDGADLPYVLTYAGAQ